MLKGLRFWACVLFMIYLLFPTASFPENPEWVVGSDLERDQQEMESFRAYFTDERREKIMNHYYAEFRPPILGKLNPWRTHDYAPEDARWHVVNMHFSANWLEEVHYPFRESIFVAGYEPPEDEPRVLNSGQEYNTKYMVKHYRTSIFTRLFVGGLSVIAIYVITNRLSGEFGRLMKDWKE